MNGLPTHFAAVRLACRYFGVDMPDLEETLQLIRSQENAPDKYFPRKLNRVMLGKAEREVGERSEGLCTVAYRALHSKIRFVDEKPAIGAAATLAECLAIDFTRLYSDLLSRLHVGQMPERTVLKNLIREVFLPTLFLELKRAHHDGLGNELSVKDCWYLPLEQRGIREYPFQRVLNAWLNAAGCRYAHDIGKILSDSKRKLVSNWLKGRNAPYGKEISELVNAFRDDAKRFDAPEVWKARLTLAAAMQRLCKEVDEYFLPVEPGYSFKFLGMLGEIEKECIPIDSDEILADRKSYFIARLVYRRMVAANEWKDKIAKLPTKMTGSVSDSKRRTSTDQVWKKMERAMNSGNVLLRCIKRQAARYDGTIEQQIFALGVEEVNRLLA